MKNTIVRLLRILVKNSIKIITLLLAVSIVSFTLVSISPIEPVQQYLLGLGTAVSPEKRVELEQYWGVDKPPVERYMICSMSCCTAIWESHRFTADRLRR